MFVGLSEDARDRLFRKLPALKNGVMTDTN